MKPGKFKKVHSSVARGYDNIADLDIHRSDEGAIYSAWRPSLAERIKILFGQSVIVGVLSERQPPITVIVGEKTLEEP